MLPGSAVLSVVAEDKALKTPFAVSLKAEVAVPWHSATPVLVPVYEQHRLGWTRLLGNCWGLGEMSLESAVANFARMDTHSAAANDGNRHRTGPTDSFAGQIQLGDELDLCPGYLEIVDCISCVANCRVEEL